MEGIFIKLLNLSIQASILITVVLLLRFILNKSPKSIKYADDNLLEALAQCYLKNRFGGH